MSLRSLFAAAIIAALSVAPMSQAEPCDWGDTGGPVCVFQYDHSTGPCDGSGAGYEARGTQVEVIAAGEHLVVGGSRDCQDHDGTEYDMHADSVFISHQGAVGAWTIQLWGYEDGANPASCTLYVWPDLGAAPGAPDAAVPVPLMVCDRAGALPWGSLWPL